MEKVNDWDSVFLSPEEASSVIASGATLPATFTTESLDPAPTLTWI